MGQLVNITNITSAVAGTLGVDALTGWTRVIAPAGELPAGSVSTAYLCQTDDGVAGVVRLDASAAVFAGGNTYHRVSYRVRLIKTDNEVDTAPSTATFLTITDDTTGLLYSQRLRMAYTAPLASPDLRRYTPSIGSMCLYLDSQFGFYGDQGGFNHTESGGMFRSAAGSATSPSGGVFAPNFPLGQWMRMDVVYDNANKRGWLEINGYVCGFYSFKFVAGQVGLTIGAITGGPYTVGETVTQTGSGATGTFVSTSGTTIILTHVSGTFNNSGVLTGGTSGATSTPSALLTIGTGAVPTKAWTVTFPAWAGFRWHLCEMSSWGDTDIANDTGLTPISDSRNWRTWSVSPTFMEVTPGATGQAGMYSVSLTNATRTFLPYSLVTGNRPLRERRKLTTTSATDVAETFVVSNLPIEWNEDGLFNVCTNLCFGRPSGASNGDTWAWTGQFTGVFPSFAIGYSSGAYRMTDAGGNELGSWAINEQVQIVFTLSRSGTCAVTVFNQSTDSTLTSPTSRIAALAASDAVPTSTFTFLGFCTAAVSGDVAEMEAWEGYKNFAFTVADSYEEAALSGTVAYVVSTFATRYRATLNRSSLLNVSDSSADCNPHGCMTFPSGPNFPRWAFSGAWGRSGKKWTSWVDANIGGLSQLQGATCTLVGGIVNDMSAATDSATSITTAALMASQTAKAARYFLDRKGRFIWIRPTFPYYRPNSSYPASPLNGQWAYDCFLRSVASMTTALETLQRTHARGAYIVIADAGTVDFEDGIHWGASGSVPAFVNAGPQVAAALGESYPQSMTTASSSQAILKLGGNKKILIPIPT